MTERLILGQVLRLDTDPAVTGSGDIGHEGHGALHLKDGLIAEVGPADALKAACPGLPVDDFGEHLILPGFIDAHAHYPQTAIIASWGKRLIDWLNTYTFPEEMRFSDPPMPRDRGALPRPPARQRHDDRLQLLHHPPESVEAFFTAAAARGMRVLAGKTCMDREPRPRAARHRARPMTTARRC
jgi:guanine deaminase